MNIERLKRTIKEDEGVRNKAYKDHLGNWTTAVGHLIILPYEDYLIEKKLTDIEVDQIFITDLNQAIDDARKFIDADTIDELAFEIVINMAFNLGYSRLSKFVKFQQALKNKDYKLASQEMLNSRWAKQVPNRAGKLSVLMEDINA